MRHLLGIAMRLIMGFLWQRMRLTETTIEIDGDPRRVLAHSFLQANDTRTFMLCCM